jgi:predicted Zn-dependent protease
MKRSAALLVLFLLTVALGCKNSPSVYFVPIGNAPTAEINSLVEHYQQKFGLTSTVLPMLVPGPDDFNRERHQLIAERMLATMYEQYSDKLEGNSAILIGITSEDMYPLGENWQFCFGWRMPNMRAAVVSTARMDLHYPGEPACEANVTTRLRKMVTKDLGFMHFGKQPSNDPRSVMFTGILGIQELDQVSEEF